MVMGVTCADANLPGVSSGHRDHKAAYVTSYIHSPPATIAMRNIQKALDSTIGSLSDERYEQSLDFFRLWFRIGQNYSQNPLGETPGPQVLATTPKKKKKKKKKTQNPSDPIFDAIYGCRMAGLWNVDRFLAGYLIGHLIPRFVDDVESDPAFAPYNTGLRGRFCTRIVQEFFDGNLDAASTGESLASIEFYVDVNLIAHCANLGYLEEDLIRDYILQSLIYHPKLHDHQADALAILFKIAGATFGAYGHPAVVSRCFELLRSHTYHNTAGGRRLELIQVNTFSTQKRRN